MRAFAAGLLLIVATGAWGAEVKDLNLPADKIPAGCKAIDGQYPVDIQISVLYDYKAYQGFLPALTGKGFQSFECDHEKTTVYFLQYQSAGDRSKAEGFIRPLLWGGDKPSGEHPELIKDYDNLLIVISARKHADLLGKAVDDRIAELNKK